MSDYDDRGPVADEAAPGATLAAARAAEKLSVAEVARHLKLSVAQVEALEAGEFDRLPGPVFVRGFVRNYARLLKLDPEALLRRVDPELSPQPASPETPPSKEIPFPPPPPRRWPLFAALGVFVVGVLAVHEFYFNEPLPVPGAAAPIAATPPAATPAKSESAGTAAAQAPGGGDEYGNPAPLPPAAAPAGVPPKPAATADAARTPAGAQLKAVAATDPARTPVPAGAPVPAAAPAAAATPAPSAATGPLLVMRFEDESWIEIRDRSGAVIFSQLNPAGSEKRVRGEPPLSLVIGNAHGVRLTYNDRAVDLQPHTKVDVARLVLE